MKLAALVSGGKDSLYAAYLAKQQGHKIKYIISIISENPESYMYHVPNAQLVKRQAELMDVELIQKDTKGVKEEELVDLVKALKKIKDEIDGVVTGAVASVYQKSRVDNICHALNLKSLSPLWGKDPQKVVEEIIAAKFDVIITAVAAPPLDENWLGRKLNKTALNELINLNKLYKISVNGEGGEYESFVTDCPLFREKIIIEESDTRWDKKTSSGVLDIKKVKTEQKQ